MTVEMNKHYKQTGGEIKHNQITYLLYIYIYIYRTQLEESSSKRLGAQKPSGSSCPSV